MADERDRTTESSTAIRENSDPAVVAAAYDAWLGDEGTVVTCTAPEAAGYSSLTYIIEVDRADGRRTEVLRSRPSGPAVFPTYDLDLQVACLRQLGHLVPTPEVLAHEPDPGPLGEPFYVMSYVEGRIPSDNPPYAMAGWLAEASPELQRAHYVNGLDLVARLGATTPADVGLQDVLGDGEGSGLDQVIRWWQHMLDWGREGTEQPTIDAAWEWLAANKPADDGRDVVLWGDARIPNVVFDPEGTPLAVLDWEMAGTGPGEIDLGWFLWMDNVFTGAYGMPGLPGRPSDDELVSRWEELVGHEARDLEWFSIFAGVRFAMTMMRIGIRAKAAGAIPADADAERNNLSTRYLAMRLDLPAPGEIGVMG